MLNSRHWLALGVAIGLMPAAHMVVGQAFTGNWTILRGFFLLALSLEAGAIMMWVMGMHRVAPWYVALARASTVAIWAVSLGGYQTLGLGAFSDIGWAILYLMPSVAVIVETVRRSPERVSEGPSSAMWGMFAVLLAISLAIVTLGNWHSARIDTKAFMLGGILLSLLGASDSRKRDSVVQDAQGREASL